VSRTPSASTKKRKFLVNLNVMAFDRSTSDPIYSGVVPFLIESDVMPILSFIMNGEVTEFRPVANRIKKKRPAPVARRRRRS
jgi:hypothetical protein